MGPIRLRFVRDRRLDLADSGQRTRPVEGRARFALALSTGVQCATRRGPAATVGRVSRPGEESATGGRRTSPSVAGGAWRGAAERRRTVVLDWTTRRSRRLLATDVARAGFAGAATFVAAAC